MPVIGPESMVMIHDRIPARQYDLFGGAIKCYLPNGLLDASDFRQIPDTQEVLLLRDSDISFIVEILERVDHADGSEAARFHFDALAHDNNATSSTVDITFPSEGAPAGPSPPAQPVCYSLVGTQTVPKFNKGAQQADTVKIFLAVWRVDAKNMDLVLTVNVPVKTGADANARGVGEPGAEWARAVWEYAKSTFVVEDFNLFA